MAPQIEASQAILDFVIRFKAGHDGLSPTYEVIGEACGLGRGGVTPPVLKHHVDRLVERGELARGPGHWGLIVPGGQWMPPFGDGALPEAPRAGEARGTGQDPPFAQEQGSSDG